MTTFNLADLFEVVADTVPDRLSVVGGASRLTYRQLDERATRFGRHLLDHGVGAGEHVAVLSWNRTEWLEVMIGAFKARAVPINVNYRYTRDEVVHVLRDSGAVALVAEADLLAPLGDLASAIPTLRHTVVLDDDPTTAAHVTPEHALDAASAGRRFGPRSGDDRYVLYTGGTTGMPKGVVWRSEDLFFGALRGGSLNRQPIGHPEELATVLGDGWSPWLVTSPLMHGNGQWNSLVPLLTGRGVVLWTRRRFDASAVAALAAAERVGLLVLVGDGMAVPFLDAVEHDPSLDLSSVRMIASGGAMLSGDVKRRLGERLPGCLIADGFGASETGANGVMVGTGDHAALPRFAMSPDVAVLGDDLRPVPSGTVGKLARRGHIPLGYWNDPEKTASTFPTAPDGVRWAIPGDHARLEDDGTITLLGRGSACINTGGEKVHPDEVAAAIKTHTDVADVADAVVLGAPDPRFGQRVVAVIAGRNGMAPGVGELRAFLRDRLAAYKAPRAVIPVEALQYTAQGKPDLRWAADLVAASPTQRTELRS